MTFLSRFTSHRNPSKGPPPSPGTATSLPTPQLELHLPSHSLLLDSNGLDEIIPESSLANSKTGPRSPTTASTEESGGSPSWEKVDFISSGGGGGGQEMISFVGARMDGEKRTNVESDGERERRKEAERRDKRLIDGATFGVGDVTDLVRECGAVIRERGAVTLGLFRPYRFAESPIAFRKLCVLFLAYVQMNYQSGKTKAKTTTTTTTKLEEVFNSKEKKLERFREELKFAGIHDVVALLKWGLRHLSSSGSFGGVADSSTPLSWYTHFLSTSTSTSHPTTAFITTLLPSLPASSRVLLMELLTLIESVSAHTESNAMSPRKLSRTLALYIFGLADPVEKEWKSWEDVYASWKVAGDALEGCFKAYLRNQGTNTLPLRLKELVLEYPRAEKGRFVRVVLVKVESQGDWRREEITVNDQTTGLEAGRSAKKVKGVLETPVRRLLRRRPLEILRAAIGAEGEGEGEGDGAMGIWGVVVGRAKEEGVKAVLDEDFVRVLDLLGLDDQPRLGGTPFVDPFPPAIPAFRRKAHASEGGVGLASLSEESPVGESDNNNVSSSGLSSFFSVDTSSTSFSSARYPPAGAGAGPAPTWSEFTDKGFGDKVPFETNEFGLISPAKKEEGMGKVEFDGIGSKARKTEGGGVRRAHTLSGVSLSKLRPSNRESAAGVVRPLVEKVETPRPATLTPSTKIVSVAYFDLEEEFVDTYLDTLVDSAGACATWPSFVIASLSPSVISSFSTIIPPYSSSKVEHVLITENLVPFPSTEQLSNSGRLTPSTLSTSARSMVSSLAETTTTSKARWNRRMSGFFGAGGSARAKLLGSTSHDSLVSTLAHPGSRSGRGGRSSPPPPVLEMPSISSTLDLPRPSTSTVSPPPSAGTRDALQGGEKPILPPPVIIMTAPSIEEDEPRRSTPTASVIAHDPIPALSAPTKIEGDAAVVEPAAVAAVTDQVATPIVRPTVVESTVTPLEETSIHPDPVVATSSTGVAEAEPEVAEVMVPERTSRDSLDSSQYSPTSIAERRLSQDTVRAVDLDLDTVQIEEVIGIATPPEVVPAVLETPSNEVLGPVGDVEEVPEVAEPEVTEPKVAEPEVAEPEVASVPVHERRSEREPTLDTGVPTPVKELAETIEPVAVVPTPIEIASPSPSIEHHSVESSTSTVESPPPATPSSEGPAPFSYLAGDTPSPPHPSTFASSIPVPKKFLGSKTMGSIMNRKASNDTTSAHEVLLAQRAAIIPPPPPEPKKALVKRVPVPVSSVKQRVSELEAEAEKERSRTPSISSSSRSASLGSINDNGEPVILSNSPSPLSGRGKSVELIRAQLEEQVATPKQGSTPEKHNLGDGQRAPLVPVEVDEAAPGSAPTEPETDIITPLVTPSKPGFVVEEEMAPPSTPKLSSARPLLASPSELTIPPVPTTTPTGAPLNTKLSKASLAETTTSFETADSGAESSEEAGSVYE